MIRERNKQGKQSFNKHKTVILKLLNSTMSQQLIKLINTHKIKKEKQVSIHIHKQKNKTNNYIQKEKEP